MCQGFSYFPGFLRDFMLAKLATSSIRVNTLLTFSLGGLSICLGPEGRCPGPRAEAGQRPNDQATPQKDYDKHYYRPKERSINATSMYPC